MAIQDLVTSKSATTIVDNLKVTLATPAAALTPSTFTAMIGISQGSALSLAAPVQNALSKLSDIASSNSSANVSAAAALSSLNSFHSSLGFGGTPNHAAFGSFLNQMDTHIKDSMEVRKATDFMANMSYGDFGAGIKDMGSMADRGMSNVLGSVPSIGATMASAGTMFNGVDVKDFGSPLGLVKSLQSNKLANATGVNEKLTAAGVDLNDLDNPVYAEKISMVMGNINDPAAISAAANQFGVANPFAGLPSAGTNNSLNSAAASITGGVTGAVSGAAGSVTQGFSTASTAFGASLAPVVGTGGIQSLKDLSNPTKLNPSATAGLTSATSGAAGAISGAIGGATSALNGAIGSATGALSGAPSSITGLTTHLKDLGAGSIVDASAAAGLFGQIQSIKTPLAAATFPSLGGLIKDHQGTIDSMTGLGSGPKGLPSMSDFTQHLSGGPSMTDFLKNVSTDAGAAISALTSSVAGAASLIAKAGIDLAAPVANTLGSAMSFAQNLHKFGADNTGSGIGDILHNLANTSTPYGEAIKSSLAEGKNNKLLADNGITPVTTTPPPPEPGAINVEYPIKISRDFPRPPESPVGSYITVEATAISPTDVMWRIINGETTTLSGALPYAVRFSGTYAALYEASRQIKDDFTTTGPQVYSALPGMKAELDAQMSGKTPKALG